MKSRVTSVKTASFRDTGSFDINVVCSFQYGPQTLEFLRLLFIMVGLLM